MTSLIFEKKDILKKHLKMEKHPTVELHKVFLQLNFEVDLFLRAKTQFIFHSFN